MNRKFESLWDVTRWDANLHVQCTFHCGNESVVDAKRMARWYRIHCWTMGMGQVGQHLRCSRCLGRPTHIRVTYNPPTGPRWGPQTEEEWVKTVRRLRG
ncbi:hypothetical protein PX554_13710 [Sphingomonas sp. H39-1-10]|uniref:hypothetical protein n=1 Tax=Sphingomonas pollutisoli TaxID=3030829 RepID=UPI0023BA0D7A|nr:hypothetical protein [Sphingomonas pollutisoli]MDF0489192.1 hypothetical protein [Sphingomonas pollutisoli]